MTERNLPAVMVPDTSSAPDLSWLYDDEPEREYLEPVVDDDYIEAPEPDVDEIKEIIDELVAEHGMRLVKYREMNEAYDSTSPGHFEEDWEDIQNGVIETMPITVLRQMYDFRCGLLALHEPYAKLLTRESNDRDEAMAIEELVQFDFKCEERQFGLQNGSVLRLTEPAHLQRYGMLVGYDAINPRDQYCGLSMSLVDPMTCYPVFGGTGGLVEMYRIYQDTAPNIAGNYGGRRGSPEYDRILKKLIKSSGKKNTDKSDSFRTQLRQVAEAWNDDWVKVVVDDDIEIVSRKHGEHEIPFTVVVGDFDLPAATSAGTGREPRMQPTIYGQVLYNDASVDISRRFSPYDWKRLGSHRIAEAVAGRDLTMVKWSLDPHKVLEIDPIMGKGQEEIGPLRPGKVTKIKIPNKLNLITPVVPPAARLGLDQALMANANAGILGMLAQGTVPPQTSGSALNAMIEVGGAADIGLVQLIQLFKRLRAEKRLRLRLNRGGMLGKEGARGSLTVPDSRGYANTPFHRVTPDMIERTGIECDIELYNWRPDVTVAQYLMTMRAPSAATGLPLISDETARRKSKVVPDPDREGQRIEDEQLRANPAIAQQLKLRRLREERDMALEEGDTVSADDAQAAIIQLEFMFEQSVLSGSAAPMGTPNDQLGGAQQMPPMQQDPATPALPGTSLPAQGIDVGHQGGRPEEAVAPAGNTQAMTPVGGQGSY